MTYYLGYTPKDQQNTRGVVMFDIEYYTKQSDKDKEEWYSEIHCLPCVDGLTLFLKDKFNEPGFDYKQFIMDASVIQEVRGLLYEHRWNGQNNYPKSYKDAYNFHYHIFSKVIEKLFDDFTKKYGMWIDRD